MDKVINQSHTGSQLQGQIRKISECWPNHSQRNGNSCLPLPLGCQWAQGLRVWKENDGTVRMRVISQKEKIIKNFRQMSTAVWLPLRWVWESKNLLGFHGTEITSLSLANLLLILWFRVIYNANISLLFLFWLCTLVWRAELERYGVVIKNIFRKF